jgi:uncharacterized protein YbjQ (UPF0145 family)
MFPLIVNCGLPLILIFGAMFIGTITEKRHLARLDAAEDELAGMVRSSLKMPPGLSESAGGELCIGECVIATDHFKNFVAQFIKFFGGEFRFYRTMMERSRREALVRLMRDAQRKGYSGVCNVRLETADVGGNSTSAGGKGKKMVMSSIIASGTAYHAAGR